MRIRIEAHDLPGAAHGTVGVQRGRDVVDPVSAGEAEARWLLDAEAVTTQEARLDLRGAYVHGRRGERFLYLSWGRSGPDGPVMYRRAKLMLDAVDEEDLRLAVTDDHVLVARLGLTAPDGTPRCAAVRPPDVDWWVERVAPT